MCTCWLVVRVKILLTVILILEVLNSSTVLHVRGDKSDTDVVDASLQVLLWQVDSMIVEWCPFCDRLAIDDQRLELFASVVEKDVIRSYGGISEAELDLNVTLEVLSSSEQGVSKPVADIRDLS